MKSLFFLIGITLLFSCGKDDTTRAYLEEIGTISNDERFEFPVGKFNDNSIIDILKQPDNYSKSEISYNGINQTAYYYFTPKPDFVGTEFVELFFQNLDRATAEHYLTIEIRVTE